VGDTPDELDLQIGLAVKVIMGLRTEQFWKPRRLREVTHANLVQGIIETLETMEPRITCYVGGLDEVSLPGSGRQSGPDQSGLVTLTLALRLSRRALVAFP